ncbi:hypothetical protein, partial [Sinorhizobium medicae]
ALAASAENDVIDRCLLISMISAAARAIIPPAARATISLSPQHPNRNLAALLEDREQTGRSLPLEGIWNLRFVRHAGLPRHQQANRGKQSENADIAGVPMFGSIGCNHMPMVKHWLVQRNYAAPTIAEVVRLLA